LFACENFACHTPVSGREAVLKAIDTLAAN
jgi:hypothetical protein